MTTIDTLGTPLNPLAYVMLCILFNIANYDDDSPDQ